MKTFVDENLIIKKKVNFFWSRDRQEREGEFCKGSRSLLSQCITSSAASQASVETIDGVKERLLGLKSEATAEIP